MDQGGAEPDPAFFCEIFTLIELFHGKWIVSALGVGDSRFLRQVGTPKEEFCRMDVLFGGKAVITPRLGIFCPIQAGKADK
jgi:hypothetical protein